MNKLGSVVPVCAALLLAACYGESTTSAPPAQPPPMVPASAMVLSPAQASSVLTAATCDREARCNAIGPGGRYASYEQCLSANYQTAIQTFQGCEYGIKDRELRACQAEIAQQACVGILGPLEWFPRAVTCRASNLCLR